MGGSISSHFIVFFTSVYLRIWFDICPRNWPTMIEDTARPMFWSGKAQPLQKVLAAHSFYCKCALISPVLSMACPYSITTSKRSKGTSMPSSGHVQQNLDNIAFPYVQILGYGWNCFLWVKVVRVRLSLFYRCNFFRQDLVFLGSLSHVLKCVRRCLDRFTKYNIDFRFYLAFHKTSLLLWCMDTSAWVGCIRLHKYMAALRPCTQISDIKAYLNL